MEYSATLRVLVVVPFALYAEGGAAARCLIGLLRGLALHGVDVRALSLGIRAAPPPPPPSDFEVEVAYIDYASLWRQRWERVVAPYTFVAQTEFAQRLGVMAREADVVHVHGLGAGALLPLIPGQALVQLDCVTRRDRDVGWPWTTEGRIAIELLRAERRTRKRARWLLASSEEVARDLAHRSPHAAVATAPLTLDPADYGERATLREPIAGLIGTADWRPTASAVERLLTRVWPRVLERRPDAKLILAGHRMEQAVFAHLPSPPGVQWLGRVESGTAFLRSLGVLLYPLDRGSGAKVKVLESMLLGTPIVTTPPGVEGIAGRGGIVVETDDEALANATLALLDGPEPRRRAGDAVHARFIEGHSPSTAVKPVIELYERMLARRGS